MSPLVCAVHVLTVQGELILSRTGLDNGLAGRVVQGSVCFQTVGQRLDKQLCVQENRMRQNQSQDKVVRKARKGNSLDGRLSQ